MTTSDQLARAARHLALFAFGCAGAVVASITLPPMVLGVLGGHSGNVLMMTIVNATIVVSVLALSRYLLRRDGSSLATLGLRPTATHLTQFTIGTAVTIALWIGIAWTQSAWVGAEWHFEGSRGLAIAARGLAMTTLLALAEELVFRGVGLRYLRTIHGDRMAIVLSAVLFGAYHVVGSDRWAIGAVFQFVLPTLGGLLFGWAALRSGGLALPLGLHVGGNWVQASIAGFAPAESAIAAPVNALWRIPITSADVEHLTAPDLLQHLPHIVAIALAAATVWRLQGALVPTQSQSRPDRQL